jgi:hypothetical protein
MDARQGDGLVSFTDLNSPPLPIDCQEQPRQFTEVLNGGPSMGGDVLL